MNYSYNETRLNFINRLGAILPKPLHSTLIIDEIGDRYPDLHTGERNYVCALDSHEKIVAAVEALTTREIIEILSSLIPDAIVSALDAADDDEEIFQLTQRDADEIMSFVRLIDPTDSNIAAEVRDTIRDNIESVNV